MKPIFAQTEKGIGTIGGEGLGPFGNANLSSGTTAMTTLTKAISAIIGFLTVAAAIWFLFQFLIGGLSWISAGGDKNKLTEARDRLTHAFIGLIIVVAGWGILALTGQFLGWTDILTPENIIDKFSF